MQDEAKVPLWRDVARMVWQTAAILGVLGLLYVGVKHRHEIRAFYYAGRALAASPYSAEGWVDKLRRMGPEAVPACRLVYRTAKDDGTRCRAARALIGCAGLPALLDFVGQVGIDTPAETELIGFLDEMCMGGDAPSEVMVIEKDLSPPDDDCVMMKNKEVLIGLLGDYEIHVFHSWTGAVFGSSRSGMRTEKRLHSAWTVIVRRGPNGESKEFRSSPANVM